ncbi:MAG: phage Gp37/Gp68 family protein, partial [Novosphingobium sp.]|nr:phage Gp37/Gp68 family protein [Novosphingobium sp.]
MSSFYLAFLGVILAGLGARDQALVAACARQHGQKGAVLAISAGVCIACTILAAWLGKSVSPLLGPVARAFLAGLALVFAGGESLLIAPRRDPAEPSRSLAALAIVLASYQLTDAARFLVFAIAVATSAPVTAAAGGTLGGLAVIGAVWAAPALFAHRRLRLARRLIGILLVLIGLH